MEEQSDIVVIDGGFGTQLCRHVGNVVDGNPLWSALFIATDPDSIIQTHLDFLRAGANAVITNTYQASVGGFIEHLHLSEEKSIELIKKAVKLAEQAVVLFMKENLSNSHIKRPLIIGSVGPYGAHLHDYSEFTGEYVEKVTKKEIIDWHRPRVKALVEAGVDLLALETIPAQAEGEALIELLQEFPDQKAWLSFTCQDENHTAHGENFQQCVHECWTKGKRQLVAIGANCLKPKFVTPLFKGINVKNKQRIPLVIYPNSGETFDPERGWINKETCKPLDLFVKEWLNLGVKYIGGCCRTYSEDIFKIQKEVKKWSKEIECINGNG